MTNSMTFRAFFRLGNMQQDDHYQILIALFQLYDHDKDGILNFKETRNVLRCLGLIVDENKVSVT